jgi:hypothetical protein
VTKGAAVKKAVKQMQVDAREQAHLELAERNAIGMAKVADLLDRRAQNNITDSYSQHTSVRETDNTRHASLRVAISSQLERVTLGDATSETAGREVPQGQ